MPSLQGLPPNPSVTRKSGGKTTLMNALQGPRRDRYRGLARLPWGGFLGLTPTNPSRNHFHDTLCSTVVSGGFAMKIL